MMKIAKNQLKNTAKNLILLLLTILLVLLTAIGWIHDLNLDSIPENSWLRRMYMDWSYGDDGGIELRSGEIAAALPIEFAVRTSKDMRGAQYNEGIVRAFLSAHGSQIGTALSSVQELYVGAESNFCAALQQTGVYLRYESRLPLSLLTSWLGGTFMASTDPIVKSIFIGSGNTLWVRTGDGKLYYAPLHTGLPEELFIETGGVPCQFTLDSQQYAVDPETLLFGQTLELPEMVSTPPQFDVESTASLPMLLQAFGYDPYVRNRYDDAGTGKRVFVDRQSTLRVSGDGEVLFRANTKEGGLEAYLESEVGHRKPMIYQIDYARRLLENVFQSFGAEAAFYLESYHTDEQSERDSLLFRYLINGVPVEGAEGMLASVEYQDNTLVRAELNLRSFTTAGSGHVLLPTQQAAVASKQRCGLAVGYFVTENRATPARYYRTD